MYKIIDYMGKLEESNCEIIYDLKWVNLSFCVDGGTTHKK